MALLFHLAGNSSFVAALVHGNPTPIAVFQLLVAAGAVAVLARPTPKAALVLAVLFIAVTWLKAPWIGNHEVLLVLVAVALLLSVSVYDDQWLPRAAAGLRWIFVVAYGAMAMSKLNTGFLSEDVSCAVVFADEIGAWVGVQPSADRLAALSSIAIALAAELSIPILLITRRWRNAGVLLGLVFHAGLALDPVGHVFDFTSALTPMFLLFAATDVFDALNTRLERLAKPFGGLGLAVVAAIALVLNGIVLLVGWPPWLVAYPLWLAMMVWIIHSVVRVLPRQYRRNGNVQGAVLGRRLALPLIPVVVLAAANAVSPYLQVRTAAAFNMYSNLETATSAPNHLLFSGLSDVRDFELVELLDTPTDHPLSFYSNSGLAIPLENLEIFRAQSGSAADGDVVLRWLDADVGSGSRPQRLADVQPADTGWLGTLGYKLTYRRSVDLQTPARCLREWGPIG